MSVPTFINAGIAPFLPGICVSSPNGIIGLIVGIFEIIAEFVDDIDDCFDFARRRLKSHHHHYHNGTKTETETNHYHGSPLSLQYFVELLEYHGTDRDELLKLIFRKGGIAELALTMKKRHEQQGTTPSRRLQDSGDDDDDDDFDVCDFGFLAEFLGFRRRRLMSGPFDATESPFEAILYELLTAADCGIILMKHLSCVQLLEYLIVDVDWKVMMMMMMMMMMMEQDYVYR